MHIVDKTEDIKTGVEYMKIEHVKIYVKSYPERHEVLFSGLKFVDFIECVPTIENILLLKDNFYKAEKSWSKFNLVEGGDQIAKLMLDDIYNYGDFCFVDYADISLINQINDEQIAELLYLSHMFKPLKSPFFEVLQNRFAYLAHDDGWYCKLYCKDQQVPISMVMNKLQKSIKNAFVANLPSLPENSDEEIFKLSTGGLLIELDFSTQKEKVSIKNNVAEMAILKFYEVGEYKDMDVLFNNLEQIKPQISFELKPS